VSCETTPIAVATRVAPKNGISRAGSKNGFTAGSTPQVSFFTPAGDGQSGSSKTTLTMKRKASKKTPARTRRAKARKRMPRRGDRRKTAKSGQSRVKGESTAQGASVETPGAKQATKPRDIVASPATGTAPSQRRAILGQAFSPDELRKLSVQLRFGLAAATRHVRALSSGTARDIGHGDPRPADWARLDVKQFEFLTNQLAKARRGEGVLDLSSLKRGELVDLWEFLRFEADRALRNIDHLQTPGGPIRGASADYLSQNHKLEARFYTHLANQIEAIFPAENIQAEYPTGTGGFS
jgi:hypothetical protein